MFCSWNVRKISPRNVCTIEKDDVLSEEVFSVLSGFVDFENGCKKLQRVCVKFSFKTAKPAVETYDILKTAFGDKYLRRSNVFIWFNIFKDRREAVDDDLRSGSLPTSLTDENILIIYNLVRSDRRLTIREMADELSLAVYAV